MGSEWKEVTLSNIADLIGGGTPKRNRPEYWGGSIPWLSVKDFNNDYRHVDSAEESITELGLIKSSTKILTKGQLIISARGTVGALSQLSKPMAFNQSCYGISARPEYATNDFLYYLIKFSINNFRQITHGAVFDTITRTTFDYIKVQLPPLSEQKAIAHVLGTLDDRIELNRRMNETLESMAQALFKSWFVDFDPVIDNVLANGKEIPEELLEKAQARLALGDKRRPLPEEIRSLFPDEFTLSDELGWIPLGWEEKQIGDLLELAYGKSLPAKKREFGPYPVYGSGGISGYHKEAIVEGAGIIVGRKGTIGSVYWEKGDFFPIDTVFFVKQKKDFPMFWIYQNLQNMDIASLAADSAVPGVNRNAIYFKKWVVPGASVLENYWSQLSPLVDKWQALDQHNKTLSNLRDTLLPKLISGEIRIPNAEKMVEECV